jgi:hypothetical protein
MSDSLNATVIVIVFVSTISANDELELLEELELPSDPAVVLEEEDELDDEELFEALLVDPPETESPGCRLESETIVPLIGAYSFV